MLTIRRDPALFVSLGATAIRLISAFFIALTVEQQAGLNAAVAAIAGLIVAFSVADGQVAAILGIVQALIAVAIGFGLDISPENQGVIMSFVGTALAMFVRTQVIAPVGPPA